MKTKEYDLPLCPEGDPIDGYGRTESVLEGRDLAVRAATVWASLYAGTAIAHAGTNAVHALAYPLGGRFSIAHGVANAILLPIVVAFNA